jgi:hypothetical protein
VTVEDIAIRALRYPHTETEALFWRWLLSGCDAAAGDLWDELAITDLRGPGHLPLQSDVPARK